jgi:hypothetical protein
MPDLIIGETTIIVKVFIADIRVKNGSGDVWDRVTLFKTASS